MISQRSDRMLSKLARASAEQGLPPRSDLHIADVKPIDGFKAMVLVGYDSMQGDPSASQLERFFQHSFQNEVRAQLASAVLHPPTLNTDACVSVLATANLPTRPLVDGMEMRRVGNTAFIDDASGFVWHVVENNGVKHLVRQADTDLTEIIEARKSRASRKTASFSHLNIKLAAPLVAVGDQVKFMSLGNVIMLGEITSMNNDWATISANGSSHKISRDAILQIANRAQSSVAGEKTELNDYFTKVFGADFAAKLTSRLSKEENGIGSTVPTSGTGTPPSRD